MTGIESPPLIVARALARYRGTQARIRIVTADVSVDDATAARWTVEQSTGQFVATVAPGHAPGNGAIPSLVARLRADSGIDAAALVGVDRDPGGPSPAPRSNCRLVLQRKSAYLEVAGERWLLAAPALAGHLDESGLRTVYIGMSEGSD